MTNKINRYLLVDFTNEEVSIQHLPMDIPIQGSIESETRFMSYIAHVMGPTVNYSVFYLPEGVDNNDLEEVSKE